MKAFYTSFVEKRCSCCNINTFFDGKLFLSTLKSESFVYLSLFSKRQILPVPPPHRFTPDFSTFHKK